MKQDMHDMHNMHNIQGINLRPIVSYPDIAQAGASYLLSIDIELADLKAPWPYPQEEYEITFALDLRPYFSYQSVSRHEPAIVLHRFGGTYGPAEYLITASEKEVHKGNINITFINGSGIPIASLDLPCEVRQEVPAVGEQDVTVEEREPVLSMDRELAFAFEESAPPEFIPGQDENEEKTSHELIVEQLGLAGWHVTSYGLLPASIDLTELVSDSGLGIAIYGYPGFEEDYLLIIDGEKGNELAGIVKVHPIGETLAGTEDAATLSQQWLQLVSKTKRARRQVSFVYDSTGYETQFTNYLEPDAHSRTLFTFHRPETLARWLEQAPANVPVSKNDLLRSRLRRMPLLEKEGLYDHQFEAIKAIEHSLAENHSHTVVQMETGTGKARTAISTIYRLLKYGGARRILYLVNTDLQKQYALDESTNFIPYGENRSFTDIYNISTDSASVLDPSVVYISTIEDVYTMYNAQINDPYHNIHINLNGDPVVVEYNSRIPIEHFDVILFTEGEHIDYQRWQPFLEYFDTFFISIADTLPDAMLNFFKRNLVSRSISVNIFFSYAFEDESFLIELKKHLLSFKRQGLINEWYDNNINAGSDWQRERAAQLDRASIIVLLISPDFMASNYAYDIEVQRAMQRHEAGTARVIPVLLKPVYWENAPFAGLTPLPSNAQSITSWPDRDAAFLDVARALHAVINDLRSKSSPRQRGPVSPGVKEEIFREGPVQSGKKLGTTILIYDVHAKWVNSVGWSPDGERIASGGGDGTVHIWDSETGHNFLTYRSHSDLFFSRIWDARWSPDGRFIASCGIGVTVHVWDAQTGKDLVLYNHQMLTSFMTDTFTLSWSPDGASIVSATGGLKDVDQTVHVWNAATGATQLKYDGHASGFVALFNVSAVAWSPDGQYIASAGTDKTVKRRTLDPLKLFHTAQIWNANTGQHVVTCNGSSNYISSISWSPDSRYIATAEEEGVVKVWDVESGANILTHQGHTKTVRVVAWSPDGSRIASAGNDHTVHIWQATTGKLLYVYREHTGNVAGLAWSPDGTRIVSSGSDGRVRVWYAV